MSKKISTDVDCAIDESKYGVKEELGYTGCSEILPVWNFEKFYWSQKVFFKSAAAQRKGQCCINNHEYIRPKDGENKAVNYAADLHCAYLAKLR